MLFDVNKEINISKVIFSLLNYMKILRLKSLRAKNLYQEKHMENRMVK